MLKIKNGDALVDAELSLLGKKIRKGISSVTSSEITVIKSLENRGILLKGTTRKITSQEGGFLNILRPLKAAGLPLMKKILTPIAKNILLPI